MYLQELIYRTTETFLHSYCYGRKYMKKRHGHCGRCYSDISVSNITYHIFKLWSVIQKERLG